MTTNQLPAKYARLTAAEATHLAQMTREAIEEVGEEGSADLQTHLGHLEQVLRLRGVVTPGPTDVEDDVKVGRQAGSAASNQFGTFTVHSASEAQVRFLRKLIAERDTTGVTIPTTLDGISKKSASALIEKLIDRPMTAAAHATGPGRGPRLASDKQIAFVTSLFVERDWAGVVLGVDIDTQRPVPVLTSQQASAVIETLQQAPRKQATRTALWSKVPTAERKPGAYKVDGRVIRVYLGQQSGKMLAQELVDATAKTRDEAWRYLGLADRFVPADAVRMTVEECEQASAGTEDHGWCCVCGRDLDNPVSVARGIGPVCRAKQQGGM